MMNGLDKSRKGLVCVAVAVLAALLYASPMAIAGPLEYGAVTPNSPVIERALAADKISPGSTWRVYLWATDPDSDIAWITYTVGQPGMGPHSPGHMRVTPGGDGKLEGYLYLNTVPMAFSSGWAMWFTVSISVEDAAGNRSLPKLFTVYFDGDREDGIREWEKAQLASVGLAEPPLIGRIHTELKRIGEQVGPGFSEPAP